MKSINSFFFSRSINSFGDGVWGIALPLVLATIIKDVQLFGLIIAIGAVGDSCGMLLGIPIMNRIKCAYAAMIGDFLQILGIILFVLIFWATGSDLGDFKVFLLGLAIALSSLGQSLWLSSIETSISKWDINIPFESLHKTNFKFTTLGYSIGILCGGAIFKLTNIFIVVLINISSFLLMMFFEKKLAHVEERPKAHQKNIRIRDSIQIISKSASLTYMTIFAMSLKILVMGLIPFVVYQLGENNVFLASAAMSLYGLGLAGGSFIYTESSSQKNMMFRFIQTLGITYIFVAIILTILKSNNFMYIIPILALILGVLLSWSTILMRTLRSHIVPKDKMHIVVSLQGFLVRVVAPTSGLVFGLFFKDLTLQTANLAVFGVLVALFLGLYLMHKSTKGEFTDGICS